MALSLGPIEQRVYDLLSDGEAHKRSEVMLVVDPGGMCVPNNLYALIYRLNIKLKDEGEMIIGQSFGKGMAYRRVRPLVGPSLLPTLVHKSSHTLTE